MEISEDFEKGAGIIDIVDESTIYYCYPDVGTTAETQNTWAICKALKVGTAWSFKWANGSQEYKSRASERASLTYQWLTK